MKLTKVLVNCSKEALKLKMVKCYGYLLTSQQKRYVLQAKQKSENKKDNIHI